MICSTRCRFFMGSTGFTPQNSRSTLSSFRGLEQIPTSFIRCLCLEGLFQDTPQELTKSSGKRNTLCQIS